MVGRINRGVASYWLRFLYVKYVLLLAVFAEDIQNSNTALVSKATLKGRVLSTASHSSLLVGKIDGSISLVDAKNGNIRWTFDTGSPLVSSSQEKNSNVQVFPGVDGSVYILTNDHSPKLELSRVTMSQLVENSPSLTDDGSIILGSQTTTLYYLQKSTGNVLKTSSIDKTTTVDPITKDMDDDVYVFARKDYKVQSVEKSKSSVRWTVSFAEIHHLNMATIPNPHALVEYLKEERKHLEMCSFSGLTLTMGNDNSLHAKDTQTEDRKWSVSFTSAPVVVYDPENAKRNVISWDSASLHCTSEPENAVAAIQWPKKHAQKPNSKVMVDSVSSSTADGSTGGLYALPVPTISSSNNIPCQSIEDVGFGDRKMFNLFEGRGNGAMDSLRCVLDVVNTSDQNTALPTFSKPESDKIKPASSYENNGMTTIAIIGLTIMAAFFAFASYQSRRQQQTVKLKPLERLRKRQNKGKEDDTGPIPEKCDGSVHLEEATTGIDLNPSKSSSLAAVSGLVKKKILPHSPMKQRNLRPLRVEKNSHSSLYRQKNQRHESNGMYSEYTVDQISEYSASQTPTYWANNNYNTVSVESPNTARSLPSYPENVYHPCCPMIRRLPSQEEIFAWSSGTEKTEQKSASSVLGSKDDEYRILGRSLLNEVNEPSAFDHYDQRFGKPPKYTNGGCTPSFVKPNNVFDLSLSQGFNASPIHANWGSNKNHQFRGGYSAIGTNSHPQQSYYPQYLNSLSIPGMSISSLTAMHSSTMGGKSLNSFSHLSSEKFSFSNFKEGTVFRVGQLSVGPAILGYGTAGTIVFDGEFNGRPVAVKRVLKAFYDLAANEKDILILSDEHPNLVRLFAVEEDKDFVFLALERCQMSLWDYINSDEGRVALIEEGCPSKTNLKIMFDICEGLQALHNRGVVHRDLKPHNVLMTENFRAKLSDMGLGRRLVPDQSSFFSVGSGGSSGWQAPEQLVIRQGGAARQTKAMDIFSLGCLMYHCISAGRHPFGESSYTRDDNILKNKPHLDVLDDNPEGRDLISRMLEKDGSKRPTIEEVLDHPFWWNSRKKLSFLIELSDRVENEDRQEDKTLIRAFEALAGKATGGNWGARLDPLLVTNLGQYRKYTFTSLRDLLRVVRNKHNHYRELPTSLKQAMGSIPEGFCRYFVTRFPELLMTTYLFAKKYLALEIPMDKYFSTVLEKRTSNADSLSSPSSMPTIEEELNLGLDPSNPVSNSEAEEIESLSGRSAEDSTPKLQVRTKLSNPVMRTISGDSVLSASTGTPWDAVLNVIRENASKNDAQNEQEKELAHIGSNALGGGGGRIYSPLKGGPDQLSPRIGFEPATGVKTPIMSPQYRPHPRGFDSLINTEREPRLEGSETKKEVVDPYRDLQSPIRLSEGTRRYEDPNRPIVGWEEDTSNQKYTLLPFPRRPGSPICDFYQKTGFCKYHERCRFHHPPECAVRLNEDGLPVRVGEPVCEFYKNTHQCKFGGACKFNHPNMKPIYAGSLNTISQTRASP